MSELLIRVVDKTSLNPYRDCNLLKRGDVVTVLPDGWGWCGQELTNPDWRILKLPNVSELEAQAFLGAEFDSDPENPSYTLRRRSRYMDVDDENLSSEFKAWLSDSTRKAPTYTLNFAIAQVLGLRRTRPRVEDPNVIG